MISFKHSLKHRLMFCLLIVTLVQAAAVYAVLLLDGDLYFWLPLLLLLEILLAVYLAVHFYKPVQQVIDSIETGIHCFRDNDFSVTLASQTLPEFDKTISAYNDLANVLRGKQMELYQRELLLDTLIQATPLAVLLTDDKNIIVYSNNSAKDIVQTAKPLSGLSLSDIIKLLPTGLKDAIETKKEGLITEVFQDEKQVFYLTVQEFNLNSRIHYLYLLKNMTSEVNREELLVWKKVIRLISHELNNSLAPIQSLTHSAQKIINSDAPKEKLLDIFVTIERRAQHLHNFIEQYAKFARLPEPNKIRVDVRHFAQQLQELTRVKVSLEVQKSHFNFDTGQIEQVLINVIKNAQESGSPEDDIYLTISSNLDKLIFEVSDAGSGMSEEQLAQALLPFFTTKSYGTGLGLALCKDIVSAHNGRLKLFNRASGGLTVRMELPDQ